MVSKNTANTWWRFIYTFSHICEIEQEWEEVLVIPISFSQKKHNHHTTFPAYTRYSIDNQRSLTRIKLSTIHKRMAHLVMISKSINLCSDAQNKCKWRGLRFFLIKLLTPTSRTNTSSAWGANTSVPNATFEASPAAGAKKPSLPPPPVLVLRALEMFPLPSLLWQRQGLLLLAASNPN